MKTAGILLVSLFLLVLAACSTPAPTPDIPATVEAEVAEAQRQLAADVSLDIPAAVVPVAATSGSDNSGLGDAFSGEGYKIRPPLGWDANELSGKINAVFLNSTPDLQTGVVPFQANINIVIEPVPETPTMQEYVDANKRLLSLMLTDHNFIEDSESTVNGHPAHFLESTFQHEIFNLRNRQLFLLNGDEAFVVTATALDETWESYGDIFDASLRSFELD